MLDILYPIITEIIIAIVALLTLWLQNRKSKADLLSAMSQKNTEIEGLKIANNGQIMEQYRSAMADLDTFYKNKHQHLDEDYKRRLDDTKEDYHRRIASIKELNDEKYKQLERNIAGLKRQVDGWKEKYQQLKAAFDIYRENHK